tara:strand:+ start:111 stop:362 length:252 start_codon:yes stop_codon:yes gene_type:complete
MGSCLRGGDVDAVGERRDDEARGVAEVLEGVAEGGVAYVDPHLVRGRLTLRRRLRLRLGLGLGVRVGVRLRVRVRAVDPHILL